MTNFDKKEHIKSPEFYRSVAKQFVLGHETIYDAIGTVLNIELPNHSELLVIGGGGGKELSSFHKFSENWNFTILDPSEKMLKLAEYWSDKEGLQNRAKFLHGILNDFDIPDSSFDGITCVAVLHYLEVSERLAILQNVKKLLKPGGVFVSTVGVKPESDKEFQYLKKLFTQFPANNGVGNMASKGSMTLETEYKMITEKEELAMIKSAGFSDPIEICSSLFFKTYVVNSEN